MVPEKSRVLTDIEFDTMPSLTYAVDFTNGRIGGMTDRRDAVEQAVFKILNTERYRYLAYSWNYGVELEDLFGKAIPYVCTEIERRVTEALEWDDRVIDVRDFDFDLSVRNVVMVSFYVDSIYGEIYLEKYHVIEPPIERVQERTAFGTLINQARFRIDSNGYLTYSRPSALDAYAKFSVEDGKLSASQTEQFHDAVKLSINRITGQVEARYTGNV